MCVTGFFWERDIRGELGVEFFNEVWLHELVFAGNVEAEDALPLQGFGKFPAQAVPVGLLHAENEVCPPEVPLRDNDPSTGLCAH